MTFQESIKTCLTKKYVCFKGRASRSEYWFFILFIFFIDIVVTSIPFLPVIFSSASNSLDKWLDSFFSMAFYPMICSMVFFFPSLAVSVRRLQDSNLSGGWILTPWTFIPFFMPILLFIAFIVYTAVRFGELEIPSWEEIGSTKLCLLFILLIGFAVLNLYLFLRKSDPDTNRFGAPEFSVQERRKESQQRESIARCSRDSAHTFRFKERRTDEELTKQKQTKFCSTKTQYCPKCRGKISSAASFCPECGASLRSNTRL